MGYFVEVTARRADNITSLEGGQYIHRQTLKNSVRFTTLKLKNLEGEIASAADKVLSLEIELFGALVSKVKSQAQLIANAANSLGSLDVASALADLAITEDFSRPFVDNTRRLEIRGGRHPVVEAFLKLASGEIQTTKFISNDCMLESGKRIWLLTGPNMAGKSTFLRQNALIVILAQMGSFVPASSANIGIVDRIFSRVGAADDLAQGRSTFMVEMVETAAILSHATDRSFVILDEIGRGTATFDGLSIAWSVIEHLEKINKCRGLFATHYHELTALSNTLEHLASYTMRIKEWKGEIVFLHEVVSGVADKSYGIHVGSIAGLPKSVVHRAKEILEKLEVNGRTSSAEALFVDLPLFEENSQEKRSVEPSAVEHLLNHVNPETLSPRDALDLVYKLKDKLEEI